MHRKGKVFLSAALLILFSIQLLSIKIATSQTADTYHPTGYNTLGATAYISGALTRLHSDDSVYMTFRSYYSGTDTTDFVDNDASDVDSSTDKGTHSNFSAQQAGPDSIYDMFTEENTGGESSNSTLLDDGFEAADWDANWDDRFHNWQEDNSPVHNGSASAWATNGGEGYFTCDNLDASGASAIYVDFWFRKDDTDFTDFTLYYYDGSSYDLIDELDNNGGDDTWLHYTEKVTDSQYFISNFRIRFDATLEFGENVWVDDVLIKKEIQGGDNYELDLEVQWTNATYNQPNAELCIFGGTMGSEDIRVGVWSGSTWYNLFTDLTSGWNNVSVSSYLNSSTFTIKFVGGNETGDTIQDSWNIDVTLLHVWSNEYATEVEFVGLSDTETWAQLDWSVDGAWTVDSVGVTLQLYNYSLGDYPRNGNGYVSYFSSATANTDETKNQTITVNPTHSRDSTGYWKVKVKGVKITDTPFNFKVDLIKYEPTYVPAHTPFGWTTTILYALPVIFGLLFLLTAKLKRKKKKDAFSESFGMTHQQMIGKKMLLEIDPTSDYHKALFNFASEARNGGELLFIFTSMNSALHSALSGAENVKFLLLTSKTFSPQQINDKETLLPARDLSVLLNASVEVSKVQKEKTINMLFDNLSDIIIRCGFEKTYNFMRFLLEAISSPKATALFVFNPTAHDPMISSSIRGLFQNQLAYTKSGPKVGTL